MTEAESVPRPVGSGPLATRSLPVAALTRSLMLKIMLVEQ